MRHFDRCCRKIKKLGNKRELGEDGFTRLVWTPKYRKWILGNDIWAQAKQIFEEIVKHYDFDIDTLGISRAQDYVHIFLLFPLRYSISRVVGILKSVSTSVRFSEHPVRGINLP
ncbi:transposase [Thermodesulfobacteriota bacterium]